MSGAHRLADAAVREDAADGARVVEQLGERLRVRLRAAGGLLPEDLFRQLAEDVMADAIQVALTWLEGESSEVMAGPSFITS
jgi:hypothetical protein